MPFAILLRAPSVNTRIMYSRKRQNRGGFNRNAKKPIDTWNPEIWSRKDTGKNYEEWIMERYPVDPMKQFLEPENGVPPQASCCSDLRFIEYRDNDGVTHFRFGYCQLCREYALRLLKLRQDWFENRSKGRRNDDGWVPRAWSCDRDEAFENWVLNQNGSDPAEKFTFNDYTISAPSQGSCCRGLRTIEYEADDNQGITWFEFSYCQMCREYGLRLLNLKLAWFKYRKVGN